MARSNALKEFESSLGRAQELMRLERAHFGSPPKLAEQAAVEGLRGGAAVLMVAAFEYFINSCVEERLSYLAGVPPPLSFSKLPAKIRIRSVYGTLESAMKADPYGPPTPKIDRLSLIEDACRAVLTGSVNPKAFRNSRPNPSAENVGEVFGSLHLNDFFNGVKIAFERRWGRPEAHTFVRDKLDEIVSRRHVIAHTGNALNVSRADLKEGLRFLRVFAAVIDDQLRQHVGKIRRMRPLPP